METLSKREIIDLMQSDMKLWDRAETNDMGGGKITKSLNLPFGIGECVVTLEGLKDAGKKREAVGSYGAYIRGLVREQIDDEAVSARAASAAARSKYASSGDSVLVDPSGSPVPTSQEEVVEEAGQSHEEDATSDADFGESLAARGASLRDRIERTEADLTKWRRELKGIDAAIAAMGE